MMMRRLRLLLLLCAVVVAAVVRVGEGAAPPQEYSDTKLNVHMTPHAHCDTGWLKTYNQYAAGLNKTIQNANTNSILDSVLDSLEKDESRTFVWVESAFLWRWWVEQDVSTRMRLRRLVERDQFQVINGAWSMSDEAATHYISMVDSLSFGHSFLKEHLGVIPRIGWQIDPFGHSATEASLLSAKEFDALFFGRIDYQDRKLRTLNAKTQFVWRASESLGTDGQVFTGVFFDGNYGALKGFCWDMLCSDQPIQDNPAFEDYNVKDRVDDFVAQVLAGGRKTLGNHLLLHFGEDFTYQQSEFWYKNIDKLIKYVNEDGRVNVFYSTPAWYADAVNALDLEFPLKTDDFFPYADNGDSYWTGYFTSRPTLKYFERISSAMLQSARQVQFLARLQGQARDLDNMKRAMGLLQHHDAVSGTSKQHVAYDYIKLGSEGFADCEAAVDESLKRLAFHDLSRTSETADAEQQHELRVSLQRPDLLQQCRFLNESVCAASTDEAGAELYVVVYNPLARSRSESVRVPVNTQHLRIINDDKDDVPHQVIETEASPAGDDAGEYTLVFQANNVPAMGVRRYAVFLGADLAQEPDQEADAPRTTADNGVAAATAEDGSITIENNLVSVSFCSETGRMTSMTNKQDGASIALDQGYAYYKSYQGDGQKSGAYIFLPSTPDEVPTPIGAGVEQGVASRQSMRANDGEAPGCGEATITKVVQGEVVSEVWQEFDSWATQVVRLYKDADHVEVQWTVGPVPIDDNQGKEIVSQFNTDIANDATFYTDSNGREFQKRVRDYRPTWDLYVTQPVAGNFYPVNTAMYMKDDTRQFTVLTDRSQGGASIEDGSMEIMVHRRTLQDDARGVGEPLNETTGGITHYPDWTRMGDGITVRGKHFLHVSKPQDAMRAVRPLMDRLFAPLNTAFGGASARLAATLTEPAGSGLSADLPPNVHVVTVEQYAPHNLIVRLAHQFSVNEDDTYSQPVQVNLCTLFDGVEVSSVTELTLSGNQRLADLNKLVWKDDGDTQDVSSMSSAKVTPPSARKDADDGCTMTMSPMDVRTFQLDFSFN